MALSASRRMLRVNQAQPKLASPAATALNTTVTNALGADGFDWAQGNNLIQDKFANLITIAEKSNGDHCFVYSNDGGATWADDGTARSFLTRGTMQYDSANDLLHVLWKATATTDGMLYRRYSIQRDGSNHVTGLTALLAGYMQLDANADAYEHPVLIWCNDAGFGAYGALLAIWSARKAAKYEIRASMRVLSGDAADNVSGNWKAPVTAAADSIGNAPAVAYSTLFAAASGGNSAVAGWPAAARKAQGTNALDVYVVYSDSAPAYYFTRLKWKSATLDWSNGLLAPVKITNLVRAGSDGGSQKLSDLSKPTEDTHHDRMYLALGTWKDNTNGDCWSLYTLNSDDSVSGPTDVYVAAGSHSYAVVGDIVYDATTDLLVVSYGKTTARTAYLQTYRGLAQVQAETALYTANPVDIPLLPFARLSGNLVGLFRDSVNTPTPPYHGYVVKMGWH